MKVGKATLTSLVVAALAVGSSLLVVLTRDRPSSGETEQRKKNLLPVWRADEVSRLELSQARVVLQREHGDAAEPVWQLVAPVKERADPDAVERLIADLGFAAPLRSSEMAEPEAGIDAKSPRIVVTMGDSRYELRLGKAAEPPGGARYVSVVAHGAPGSSLTVVSAETAKLFATTLDELRRRELWPYGPTSLRELSILNPDGSKLDLSKDAAGRFVTRDGKRVNREALEPLIATLASLDLQRFLDPALADRALTAGPRWSLVGAAAAGKVVLDLGGKCPEAPEAIVAVRRGGIAGCVDAAITRSLQPSPEALIDRRPFSARPDEVEELSLEQGDKKLSLVRKGSAFLLRSPAEAEVALDAGNARLAAVVSADATIAPQPDLARLGLEPAAGSASIVSPGEGKAFQERVSIGKKQPDGSLHLRREDGVVLALSRDAARAFAVDTTLLRSLKLLEFTAAELESLSVEGAATQKLVRKSDGLFALELPRGFSVDGALATDLSFELGSLSALRWVADSDDGSFGLQQPLARVEIGFRAGDAGPRQRTLLVGKMVSGGHYARFQDDEAVFVIERELVEQLQTLLINRSEFVFDPAGIARMELSRAGRKIVLGERAGALSALEPKELPSGQVQSIADALGRLRAEAALHTGPARPEEGLSKPELEVRVERRNGPPRTFTIGAADAWRGESVYYARISAVDATFVIARGKLRPLLDAF